MLKRLVARMCEMKSSWKLGCDKRRMLSELKKEKRRAEEASKRKQREEVKADNCCETMRLGGCKMM